MATIVRGDADDDLLQLKARLEQYEKDNGLPADSVQLYRQNPASIRIRIIDPRFSGMSRARRHDHVWRYFDGIPDETLEQLSMLVLLSAVEVKSSMVNMEFEDPIPSGL